MLAASLVTIGCLAFLTIWFAFGTARRVQAFEGVAIQLSTPDPEQILPSARLAMPDGSAVLMSIEPRSVRWEGLPATVTFVPYLQYAPGDISVGGTVDVEAPGEVDYSLRVVGMEASTPQGPASTMQRAGGEWILPSEPGTYLLSLDTSWPEGEVTYGIVVNVV
jgi:hypothetical protein